MSTGSRDFRINYLISVERVYIYWATERILRTKFLDVLSACGDSSQYGLLPWVPDLRLPWGTNQALFCQTHGLPEGNQNPSYRPDRYLGFESQPDIINSAVLRVEGCPLGIIRALGPIGDVTQRLTNPTKLREGLLVPIIAWESMCTDTLGVSMAPAYSLSSDPSGQNVFSRLALSFANALFRGYKKWGSENHPATLMERFHIWCWNLPIPWNYTYSYPQILSADKFLENFERVLFTMVHDCQMLVLEGDRIVEKENIGVVGSDCHVRVGDEIFLLKGGSTPFVLRTRDDEKSYKLMGPCYLSQYMGNNEDMADLGDRIPPLLKSKIVVIT